MNNNYKLIALPILLMISLSTQCMDIHEAARKGNIDRVRELLDQGVSVDVGNDYGERPLTIACNEGHTEVARVLLDRGAGKNGRTTWIRDMPLYKACSNGHESVVRLLVSRGAYVGDNYDGDANEYDDAALHVACRKGYEGIVQVLLNAGARASMDGFSGCTPLFYAAGNGHEGIVRLLVSKGVDVNKSDIRSYSPLQAACKNGHEQVVKLLLEAGANVHATTPRDPYSRSSPKTALELAQKRGHTNIVSLLRAHVAQIPPSAAGGAAGVD